MGCISPKPQAPTRQEHESLLPVTGRKQSREIAILQEPLEIPCTAEAEDEFSSQVEHEEEEEDVEAQADEDALEVELDLEKGLLYESGYGLVVLSIFGISVLGVLCWFAPWKEIGKWFTTHWLPLVIVVGALMAFAACTVIAGAIAPHYKWVPAYEGEVPPNPLKVGFDKSITLALLAVIVFPFYADIITDLKALGHFYAQKKQWAYGVTNTCAIAIGAIAGGALLLQERRCNREAFQLAIASVFQLIPLICLLMAIYLFLTTTRFADFRKDLIYKYGLMGLLTSTSLVEGLVEALISSEVQMQALIHEHDAHATKGKSNLKVSVALSILSMTLALSKLDQRGQPVRYINAKPILEGTAPPTSMAFNFVVLVRLTWIVSRMLLFPLASELMHDELFTLGTPLMAGIDLLLQMALILRCNKWELTWRIVYAIPNVISPVEPLLLKSPPVISTNITHCAAAHITELVVVLAMVLRVQGFQGIYDYFENIRPDNKPMLVIWIAATTLVYPLLWVVRRKCAHPVPMTFGKDSRFQGISREHLDNFDTNVPMANVYALQQDVELSDKHINDAYAKVLAIAVSYDRSLRNLHLHKNPIGHEGVAELIKAVKHSSALREIFVADYNAGKAQTLVQMCRQTAEVEELDLSKTDIHDFGIHFLAGILQEDNKLKSLKLNNNDNIGATAVRDLYNAVTGNKTLQELVVPDCDAGKTEQVLPLWREAAEVEELDYSDRDMGGFGVHFWAGMLHEDHKLKTLTLINSNIDDDDAQFLAHALRHNNGLKSLNLRGNEKINTTGARHLVHAVAKNETLEKLFVSAHNDKEAEKLVKACRNSQDMEQALELFQSEMGTFGAFFLAEMLKQNTRLTTLDLFDNDIGDVGAAALAGGLLQNNTLQKLGLYNNNIGDDGTNKLAEALKQNATLKDLDMRYSHFSSEAKESMRASWSMRSDNLMLA